MRFTITDLVSNRSQISQPLATRAGTIPSTGDLVFYSHKMQIRKRPATGNELCHKCIIRNGATQDRIIMVSGVRKKMRTERSGNEEGPVA